MRELVNDDNIVFSLEPIVENSEFWLLIDKAEKVYKFKLTLRSPNLFRGFNSTDEFMRSVEEATNTDLLSLRFKSKSGNLAVEPDQFAEPLRYADGGGGDWEVQLTFPGNSEKVKIRSGDKIKTFSLPSPSEKESLFDEDDKKLLNALNEAEEVLPKRKSPEE